MRIYALTLDNGNTAVMRLIEGDDLQIEIDHYNNVNAAKVIGAKEIRESDVPKDRSNRNGWKL